MNDDWRRREWAGQPLGGEAVAAMISGLLACSVVRGIGIDAVEIERFRRLLERRPAAAARLFTEGELAYGARQHDPAPRLAARFAAKEAVMKALGVGLGAFAFRDVEVVSAPSGAPSLVLRGGAEALAGRLGVEGWRLSLTHTASTASAVAVAL